MKRRSSRCCALIFAARAGAVIPVITCYAVARANGHDTELLDASAAGAGSLRQLLRSAPPAASSSSASYFYDVPTTVIGVYGGTQLDGLSGSPLVLVRWPDDCCSPAKRWHVGHPANVAPVSSREDESHILFLWPEV